MSKNNLLKYVDYLINHKPAEKVFVGFLEQSNGFFEGCSYFDKRAFIYAANNFPLQHELLKHVRFLSLFKQKWIFDDVMSLVYRLSPYVSLSKTEICKME